MAFKIDGASCNACGACEFECPNAAIAMKGDTYFIKVANCTECDGDLPKCVGVCPVDDCIGPV